MRDIGCVTQTDEGQKACCASSSSTCNGSKSLPLRTTGTGATLVVRYVHKRTPTAFEHIAGLALEAVVVATLQDQVAIGVVIDSLCNAIGGKALSPLYSTNCDPHA
jgi:hypothetical protein